MMLDNLHVYLFSLRPQRYRTRSVHMFINHITYYFMTINILFTTCNNNKQRAVLQCILATRDKRNALSNPQYTTKYRASYLITLGSAIRAGVCLPGPSAADFAP